MTIENFKNKLDEYLTQNEYKYLLVENGNWEEGVIYFDVINENKEIIRITFFKSRRLGRTIEGNKNLTTLYDPNNDISILNNQIGSNLSIEVFKINLPNPLIKDSTKINPEQIYSFNKIFMGSLAIDGDILKLDISLLFSIIEKRDFFIPSS